MFQGQNGPLILVSLIGITVLALIYHSQRRPTNLLRLSLGLQMGGAAGNFLDRLCLLQEDCQGGLWARFQQGYVTDFIDVGTWPIFNLADSSIVVGLALLAWLFLRPERFGGGRRSTAGIGTLQPVAATGRAGVYARCPICDGEMLAAGHGWHCSVCGVKERIDAGHGSPETPVVAEQSAAAWGTGSTPMGPAGANQTSSVPPSEAAPSADLATGPMPDVDAGGAASPYHQEVPGNSGAGGPL